MRNWIIVVLGVVAACSSGGDAQSQCKDYCAKAQKACGAMFDVMSCNASCASTSDAGSQQASVPMQCKSKADAYSSCTRSAQLTCPDGVNPRVTGCDAQLSELTACVTGGGGDAGSIPTGDSGAAMCKKAGDICFDDADCCSKSCDMDTFECQ